MSTSAKYEGSFFYRSPIAKLVNRLIAKAVDRRSKPTTKHYLDRKKLYIFPSLRGMAFLVILYIIWLLGTNYQNNLILGLVFLLCSVFVISIMKTHANVSGLTIEYVGASPAFAGEYVEFIFNLSSNKNVFIENIEIGWVQEKDRVVNIVIAPNEPLKVRIPQKAIKRGWQKPGQMLLQSYYPLGILRCWTWLNWNSVALIYPEPIASSYPKNSAVITDGDGEHPVTGGEDYTGLRNYVPGDSLKQIAWKPYAQEKGLFVKEFSQNVSQERWLVFEDAPFIDTESKLSAMCHWVLELSDQDEFFGVVLPNQTIDPDKGENHRRRVLEALAAYEA